MFRNKIYVRILIFLIASQFLASTTTMALEKKDTLRVLLYPYVPDRLSLFQKLENDFEKDNDVNLELVDTPELVDGYYSGELQSSSADVYEVDTILLSDLIKMGKISKIDFPKSEFSNEAVAAVSRSGNTYAVPHWQCGNFLFYHNGDSEIANAKSWSEIQAILKTRNQSLLVDLKGKSTLGEWYFTMLSEINGVAKAQEAINNSDTLDANVTTLLNSVLASCPDGFCRDNNLHERTGYYARAFISGKASVYIGYSESIHYGIKYGIENCTSTSGCLSISDIAVRKLPTFTNTSMSGGVGWVDGLAIDSSIVGKKRELALKLISYLTSEKAYKSILTPQWMEAPRYLLPARTNVHIEDAPLYKSFIAASVGRETGSLLGLNDKLRAVGKKLDCALPINRTDVETKMKCQL
jgi:thiamine pyridinylase